MLPESIVDSSHLVSTETVLLKERNSTISLKIISIAVSVRSRRSFPIKLDPQHIETPQLELSVTPPHKLVTTERCIQMGRVKEPLLVAPPPYGTLLSEKIISLHYWRTS
mmetsp:Transcript_13264/g.23595  ORF Transcript_13264/g.23595 Transcript_13264/m.23595 type:complete len:109 (+) Transcript_13264:1298-1624(+)